MMLFRSLQPIDYMLFLHCYCCCCLLPIILFGGEEEDGSDFSPYLHLQYSKESLMKRLRVCVCVCVGSVCLDLETEMLLHDRYGVGFGSTVEARTASFLREKSFWISVGTRLLSGDVICRLQLSREREREREKASRGHVCSSELFLLLFRGCTRA